MIYEQRTEGASALTGIVDGEPLAHDYGCAAVACLAGSAA